MPHFERFATRAASKSTTGIVYNLIHPEKLDWYILSIDEAIAGDDICWQTLTTNTSPALTWSSPLYLDRSFAPSPASAMPVQRTESVILNLAQMGAPKVGWCSGVLPKLKLIRSDTALVFRFTKLPRKVLLGIVLLLGWTENIDLSMKYTFVEFFAGKGNVSAMFRKDPKHVVASSEKDYSRSMDFMSPAGLSLLERFKVRKRPLKC